MKIENQKKIKKKLKNKKLREKIYLKETTKFNSTECQIVYFRQSTVRTSVKSPHLYCHSSIKTMYKDTAKKKYAICLNKILSLQKISYFVYLFMKYLNCTNESNICSKKKTKKLAMNKQ